MMKPSGQEVARNLSGGGLFCYFFRRFCAGWFKYLSAIAWKNLSALS